MGVCCSRSHKRPTSRNLSGVGSSGRENELLKAFLSECNGVDRWDDIGKPKEGQALVSKKRDPEVPSLVWYRGTGYASGNVNDVFHYFENDLGGDRFELLEEIDERRSVYHWLHEFRGPNDLSVSSFSSSSPQGSFNNRHRKSALPEPSSPNLHANSNNNINISNNNNDRKISEDAVSVNLHPSEDGIQKVSSLSRTPLNVVMSADVDAITNITTTATAHNTLTPEKAKSRKSTKSIRKPSTEPRPVGLARNRDFVMFRSTFKLGPSRICMIAESCEHKLKRRVDEDTVRGRIYLMGVLVEEIDEAEKKRIFNFAAFEANAENDPEALIQVKRKVKEPLTRMTFLIAVNPRFTAEEALKLPDNDISLFLGEGKVREIVEGAKAYFELEENKLFVKFRALAAAPIGEMGWAAQEKSKTDLQLGTNVKHPVHGHGIVKKFDMKGRIHVTYDNGEEIEHEPNEKDSLHVAVQIGTRVVHPTRGAGTVKQFDEMGRIHVKFDNGEYHRYKQGAWKKKMHEYKLLGTGGALETITISYRDFEESREKQGRVRFAVGVPTIEVLEYLLNYEEDAKTGNILSNQIIEEISPFHRIRYQRRKMPQPLTDREFIYDEIYRQVAPHTYVIINRSINYPAKKETPGIVRGMIYLSGYLIEPLYTEDGMDHIAQITHVLCIDPQGFVPPEAVAGIRAAQLLGAVTDMRAHFWRRTQQKKSVSIVNRKRTSHRASSGLNSIRLKFAGT